MTDIVEQAARRLYESGAPFADSKYWAQRLADAGLLRDPARTVPTRERIAEVVDPVKIDSDGLLTPRTPHEITGEVLALLADQPTVAEVKAAALEEFAAHIENTAQRDDVRLTEHAVNEAGGAYLAREQAHEIKGRK